MLRSSYNYYYYALRSTSMVSEATVSLLAQNQSWYGGGEKLNETNIVGIATDQYVQKEIYVFLSTFFQISTGEALPDWNAGDGAWTITKKKHRGCRCTETHKTILR
jgi:hypothetical protein